MTGTRIIATGQGRVAREPPNDRPNDRRKHHEIRRETIQEIKHGRQGQEGLHQGRQKGATQSLGGVECVESMESGLNAWTTATWFMRKDPRGKAANAGNRCATTPPALSTRGRRSRST